MSYKDIFLLYLKSVKGYEKYYVTIFLASIVTSFEPMAYSYIIAQIIDFISSGSASLPYIFAYVTMFVIIIALLEFTYSITRYSELKAFPNVRKFILCRVYDIIQNSKYSFFQSNQGGAIMSRIKAINCSYDDVVYDSKNAIICFLKIFTSIVYIVHLDKVLGVVLVLLCCLFLCLLYKISREFNECICAENNSLHNIMNHVSDRIRNIKSIFLFSTTKREFYSLNKSINDDYIPAQQKSCRCKLKMSIIGGIIYVSIFMFVITYSIYLKNTGIVTVGNVVAILGLTLSIVENLWDFISAFQDVAEDLGELSSAFSIIEKQDNSNDQLINIDITQAPQIEFSNVSFSYPENDYEVLKNFNLIIKSGEKIGIVGKSGAGKSSLLSLLLKYFEYSEGSILINDIDIKSVNNQSLRDHIGLIPQDTILFDRSIMENMKYACPKVDDEVVHEICKKINFHETIMRMPDQYNTCVGENGGNLSGGQRQLVSIVRAFLKRPHILLLDEATSALDAITENMVNQALDVLIDETHPTLISIAHKLHMVNNMDRIIIIENGIIIESGNPKDLLNDPTSVYAKMWTIQTNR